MSSSESVNKKFDKNQNLVEDILGAAVASITKAHVQEKSLVKFMMVKLLTLRRGLLRARTGSLLG